MPQRVGFIGLGLMGKPMAHNVLKAGFPLVVHNRSRAAVDELVAAGASAAASPAEVAGQVDVVLTCLPGPADVELVYLGDNGVLSAAKPGLSLVDMSTIDPGTHQKISALAEQKGAGYLDGPVSGGTYGAQNGILTIMIGGSAETLETVRPVLLAMGQKIYHCGPVGHGAVVKLVNQLMGSVNALGMIEGMVLGTKAGVDPAILYEVVSNSSGSSRTLMGSVPNVLKRDFDPGFMIDLMYKDIGLAVDLAKQTGVRTLAAALAQQIIQETRLAGFGRLDTRAQIIPLERNAGVEVKSSERV